jgi:hypothetical protein
MRMILLSMMVATVAQARTPRETARVFFAFARQWDTPLDDAAMETVRRLRKDAPDATSFAKQAPAGSKARAQVERYLVSMSQLGMLARTGALSLELAADGWYDPSSGWTRSKPWVVELRSERKAPQLYADFDWLAQKTVELRDARKKQPLPPPPLPTTSPTPDEALLFFEFAALWDGPRDVEAAETVARLAHDVPSWPAFKKAVPFSSHDYTMFDRYYCLFEMEALLVKLGALRPDLAASLGDPRAALAMGKQWIAGVREETKTPELYENVEWLAQRLDEVARAK